MSHRENNLIHETSPYLLQHAHNPVAWYPWGDEALQKAHKEEKPIFLSIGYAACHWCHVMETESFEDPSTAELLNRDFIAIKVDREERPDLDSIYMSAVQIITGRGGWPLSVFLTPELKPFYGGTYFPSSDKYGMPTFKAVLTHIATLWNHQRTTLTTGAEEMTTALKNAAARPLASAPINPDTLAIAVDDLADSFDPRWGGFGGAPKFPPAPALAFLMRNYAVTGEKKTAEMITCTLDRMAGGGLYDQLAGGFHRYSVDEQWLVPHFEKMLYDNALLAPVYLDAYRLTSNPWYRQIATETLDYVIRDMTDTQGGFYASQDADSEGEEGKCYVWSRQDIEQVLSASEAALAMKYYGVTAAGNFEGRNILHLPLPAAEFAVTEKITTKALNTRLTAWRSKLLAERNRRIPPATDTKIIASWNGLMISALAKGYEVLGEERFRAAAERAALFATEAMTRNGELVRTYAGGKPGAPAYLDDYADIANAMLDLYLATFNTQWFDGAMNFTGKLVELFGDDVENGLYFTSRHHRHLLTRPRDFFDSSTPSGNAIAARVLLRFGRLTGNKDYISNAGAILTAAAKDVQRAPTACLNMLVVANQAATPSQEIAIIGKTESSDTRSMISCVRRHYLPNAIVVFADPDNRHHADLVASIPLLKDKVMLNGHATAYVCENFSCHPPTTSVESLTTLLAHLSPTRS